MRPVTYTVVRTGSGNTGEELTEDSYALCYARETSVPFVVISLISTLLNHLPLCSRFLNDSQGCFHDISVISATYKGSSNQSYNSISTLLQIFLPSLT